MWFFSVFFVNLFFKFSNKTFFFSPSTAFSPLYLPDFLLFLPFSVSFLLYIILVFYSLLLSSPLLSPHLIISIQFTIFLLFLFYFLPSISLPLLPSFLLLLYPSFFFFPSFIPFFSSSYSLISAPLLSLLLHLLQHILLFSLLSTFL